MRRQRRNPSDVERLGVLLFSRLAHGYWFTRPRVTTLWAHLRGMNLGECFAPTLELARTYSEHAPVMTLVSWFSRGIAYARRSLAIRQSLGDVGGQGQSLAYYGLVLYAAARFRECADACREAIRLLERTGDYWQVHIARFQLSCALYRLGDMAGACEQARLHYDSGIEVGDEQASGVSLDIWARSSCGAIPKQILETELQRERSDSQGMIQVLFAKGVQLYYAGRIEEATDSFAQASQVVVYTRVQNAYTQSCLAWWMTCLRRQLEDSEKRTPSRWQELLDTAEEVQRKALRSARKFPCDLPHVLRECAYLQAMRGRPRQAPPDRQEPATGGTTGSTVRVRSVPAGSRPHRSRSRVAPGRATDGRGQRSFGGVQDRRGARPARGVHRQGVGHPVAGRPIRNRAGFGTQDRGRPLAPRRVLRSPLGVPPPAARRTLPTAACEPGPG